MLTAYRAALPGTVLLSSIIAFSLAICCLLAGTNPKTLPNMQLYTLNTSRIGAHIQRQMGLPAPDPSFNFSSILSRDLTDKLDDAKDSLSSKGDDLIGDAAQAIKDPKAAIDGLKSNITSTINDGKDALEAAANKIKDKTKNATAEIVSTFINETISTIEIQDFYIAHLTTYCSGHYSNGKNKQEILYCSNGKPNLLHNTTANGTKHDGPFDFIDNLHLPDPISYAMKAITLLSQVIAAMYIIALISLVIAILTSACSIPGSITSVTGGSPKLRKVSFACTVAAFLFLLLGTLSVNTISGKMVRFFAEHDDFGIAAGKGKNFLGVSVAAVVFTGIAILVAFADVMVGRAVGKVTGVGKKGVSRLWHGRGRGKGKGKQEECELGGEMH